MVKSFKIRTVIIFLGFCLLYLIILSNLYFIQIRNNKFFTGLGEQQYNVTVVTLPPRATIFDRTGKHMLAMNKDSVSAFILPKTLTQRPQLSAFLRKHFPAAHERLQHAKKSNFMYIARRLTPEQIKLIKESKIEDIQLLNEPGRFYPVEAAGCIIGITDIDNKGLFGLEQAYNQQLAGKATKRSLQKDARSGRFYFSKEVKIAGEQGTTVTTTIDSDLQFLAYTELKKHMDDCGAKQGSVLIMDPTNGEILAMANHPSFNPNETRTINLEYTKNNIVTDAYELGSVIKVCAALAALEEGAVRADDLIDCENALTTYVDGRMINTVPSSVAGLITFSQVMERSNNIGIAKVVRNLGPKLYDHYRRLGFGKKTGIQFPGEHDGFVNPPNRWSKQSVFSLSYGYEITGTLLQLARVFSMIANGGYMVQPTLIKKEGAPNFEQSQPLYSATTIQTIQGILEKTVEQGSAQKAQIKGYRIMGKTGTGNLLIDGVYSKTKNIYTFSGIIEKGSYKRVIVTFINEIPKGGRIYASTIAAPLFERVAERTLIHDKIIE